MLGGVDGDLLNKVASFQTVFTRESTGTDQWHLELSKKHEKHKSLDIISPIQRIGFYNFGSKHPSLTHSDTTYPEPDPVPFFLFFRLLFERWH